ncbi:DSD1 family PLP-dependent enzyme [Chitinimonas koreensis]|uniref:DSD1 family PLP-dependent enzyme n=1 Tax=Chitinimonas koreensis TaxID=356302 RepID=UPI000425A46A|nr:DSD1 family PLP-dependent enzyme [Chitinimonas koreensis]QNM94685.1 DSD1 family PLP-dependent enzyme [Chitinimonas koreensis]
MSLDPSLVLPPPARPGDPLSAIDTPALLVELDAFERNLARMQARADAAGVALRPHAKAHKCPAIAQAQLRQGAVGICCQKVSEALPFVLAGVPDILVSNEIAGPAKAALLARMALHARMSVCVDHAGQIAALAATTAEAGSRLDVLVEVDIGQERCGVADAPAVLRLLEALAAHPQLRFKGLQAYHGAIQHLRGHAERAAAAARAAERTAAVLAELQRAGVRCEVVTGGGTGSVEFDLASGVYTEVQPGSYPFMDADYGSSEYGDALRFEHSLFLASTVMSCGNGERIVLDAGLKSLAVDSGLPRVWDDGRESGSLVYAAANDEHGIVRSREAGQPRPALGSMLLLVPGHCDPTLNLHDELVAVRAGRVEAIWPIAARGLSR